MGIIDEKVLQEALSSIIHYTPKIALALLTLLIGLWIINKFTELIRAALDKNKVNRTLTPFLVSTAGVLARIMLLLSVASILGVETTSFIAVLGAAGFAIGLALQGSLTNFAGGILILILRPFKVGDYISAQDHEGFIKEVQILVTFMQTFEGQQIIIPNGPLAAGNIVNFNTVRYRRVDVNFIISYDNDLDYVRKILLDIAAKDDRILKETLKTDTAYPIGEAPVALFHLDDLRIGVSLRVWANPYLFYDVFYDLSEQVKKKIGKEIHGPNSVGSLYAAMANDEEAPGE